MMLRSFKSVFSGSSLPHHWQQAVAHGALIAAAAMLTAGCAATPSVPVQPMVRDIGSVAAQPRSTGLPATWNQTGFMQIFVRSYQDSNGDGIGDLRGLTSRLDYLKDLGVTGLWLMPLHPSEDGDHGYAVADYRAIDPAYGTLQDFDLLLAEAHKRGMGVILDYVINHGASTHPTFLHARDVPGSTYRDWFSWLPEQPADWKIYGGNPWRLSRRSVYFAPFSESMPDWNLRNADVVRFHEDNLRFWLNRGVDGFRFDAVGHLFENGKEAWNNQPENHPFMARIQALVKSYPGRYIVCEAPGDSRGFARESSCGSAFAFDLAGLMIRAGRGDNSVLPKLRDYFKDAPAGMATMLANHDAFAGIRVWDQVGGDESAYRLAATTLLTLPGRPFIYYGEEVGMAGATSLRGDPALRSPMSWNADPQTGGFTTGMPYRALSANANIRNVSESTTRADSLHRHYQSLLRLRASLPALQRGSYAAPLVEGSVFAFQRVLDEPGLRQTVMVLINYGAEQKVRIRDLSARTVLERRFPTGVVVSTAPADDGTVEISVPAQSAQVFVLR